MRRSTKVTNAQCEECFSTKTPDEQLVLFWLAIEQKANHLVWYVEIDPTDLPALFNKVDQFDFRKSGL
jgi:hypothetical protein